jgi:hypothetical protein
LHQPVANAEFGEQNARFRWVLLDLFPKLADEYAQVMRVVRPCDAPNLLEQMLMGDDATLVLCQYL